MLALESADSIRFLYRHFLSKITEKSLNAFYYACSYAKADYSGFMNTTASLAMRLVPELLRPQPVFLCIDDTLVPKSGRKFEDVSSLFDHAAHGGSNYLNGHCFVSLMLRVPVWRNRRVSYLEVPLGYRMWKKAGSKLALAAGMVRQVMPTLAAAEKVIVLCDSWYGKRTSPPWSTSSGTWTSSATHALTPWSMTCPPRKDGWERQTPKARAQAVRPG